MSLSLSHIFLCLLVVSVSLSLTCNCMLSVTSGFSRFFSSLYCLRRILVFSLVPCQDFFACLPITLQYGQVHFSGCTGSSSLGGPVGVVVGDDETVVVGASSFGEMSSSDELTSCVASIPRDSRC